MGGPGLLVLVDAREACVGLRSAILGGEGWLAIPSNYKW